LIEMSNLRSWGRHLNDATQKRISDLNDAALERISDALPRSSRTRVMPMVGMLLLGLVAGAAIGGYVVSQRSQLNRFSEYPGAKPGEGIDLEDEPVGVTTHRANNRRKTTSEV
jgi:hypothetical protein